MVNVQIELADMHDHLIIYTAILTEVVVMKVGWSL